MAQTGFRYLLSKFCMNFTVFCHPTIFSSLSWSSVQEFFLNTDVYSDHDDCSHSMPKITFVNCANALSFFHIQLDRDNSNSDNSKSLLIRNNSHSPWSALLLIFTSLIRIPVNSNHFSFALGPRINVVQL